MAEAVGLMEHGAGGAGGVMVTQVACQVAEGQGSQVFKICHYTPLSVRYFGRILCYHGMHREGLGAGSRCTLGSEKILTLVSFWSKIIMLVSYSSKENQSHQAAFSVFLWGSSVPSSPGNRWCWQDLLTGVILHPYNSSLKLACQDKYAYFGYLWRIAQKECPVFVSAEDRGSASPRPKGESP